MVGAGGRIGALMAGGVAGEIGARLAAWALGLRPAWSPVEMPARVVGDSMTQQYSQKVKFALTGGCPPSH